MDEENIFLIMNLLHAPGSSGNYDEPIDGITRLTKLLFLLKEESNISNQLMFVPYKMGPFSSEIYKVIEFMKTYPDPNRPDGSLLRVKEKNDAKGVDPEALKYINDAASDADDPQDIKFGTSTFELTDIGKKVAAKVWDSLPSKEQDAIQNVKAKYGDLTLKDLLRYVYKTYPDMAVKSEIKHQLL